MIAGSRESETIWKTKTKPPSKCALHMRFPPAVCEGRPTWKSSALSWETKTGKLFGLKVKCFGSWEGAGYDLPMSDFTFALRRKRVNLKSKCLGEVTWFQEDTLAHSVSKSQTLVQPAKERCFDCCHGWRLCLSHSSFLYCSADFQGPQTFMESKETSWVCIFLWVQKNMFTQHGVISTYGYCWP